MKHDLFELNALGMTHGQRAWRIAFILVTVGVVLMDLLVWRP